jgi:hypothetical protein
MRPAPPMVASSPTLVDGRQMAMLVRCGVDPGLLAAAVLPSARPDSTRVMLPARAVPTRLATADAARNFAKAALEGCTLVLKWPPMHGRPPASAILHRAPGTRVTVDMGDKLVLFSSTLPRPTARTRGGSSPAHPPSPLDSLPSPPATAAAASSTIKLAVLYRIHLLAWRSL